MAQESTPSWAPFSSVGFSGLGSANGKPVNRSNAGYKTVGGQVDPADTNPNYFGSIVSSIPNGTPGMFNVGCPVGSMIRGFTMFDAAVAQNDPAKSDRVLNGLPITVIFDGSAQFTTWTNTQVGSHAFGAVLLSDVPIFKAVSAGIGAAPVGALEFVPISTLAPPLGWAFVPAFIVEVDEFGFVTLECNFGSGTQGFNTVTPFMVKGVLTSAAAATAVPLLPDAMVPAGKKVYILNAFFTNTGATLWATTTIVKIQDTSAVVGITVPVANLGANAINQMATTGIILGAPVSQGAGFTANKGINLIGDVNGTGSNLAVTVMGYIA